MTMTGASLSLFWSPVNCLVTFALTWCYFLLSCPMLYKTETDLADGFGGWFVRLISRLMLICTMADKPD